MQRTLDKQFKSFTQQETFIIGLKYSKLFRHPWTLEEDIILLGAGNGLKFRNYCKEGMFTQ